MTALQNQSEFTIKSGNCGTSEKWKPTFDDCIVIQKNTTPQNLNRRVALNFVSDETPIYFEVRFFEDQSNTYKYKKRLTNEPPENLNFEETYPNATSISRIIKFLEDHYTAEVTDSKIRTLLEHIISFIRETPKYSDSDSSKMLKCLNQDYPQSLVGGSNKRYRTSRKSRKYQSRKKSRRHFQRRKRTHRRKSRTSRRSRK